MKLQPQTEVVGKVSILLEYHIFFSGATEMPRKQNFGPCTPTPPPLPMFNIQRKCSA